MRNMILASRYARALYNLAKDSGVQDQVFGEMRAMSEAFGSDGEIRNFS